MSLLQRVFLVEPTADVTDLFDQLSQELRQVAANWINMAPDDELLASWPTLDQRQGARRIAAETWQSQQEPTHRLLMVQLGDAHDGATTELRFKLGMLDNSRVVLQEEFDMQPMPARLPVAEIPRVLDFLARYRCLDEDERVANQAYLLSKARVADFARFLESPATARQLAVVLIAASPSSGAHSVDKHEFLSRLQGLAHIILLEHGKPWHESDLPIAHKCYNGAVRVYLPGYRQDDPQELHRYWRKEMFAPEHLAGTCDEIVRYVLEKLHLRFHMHPIFIQLARDREEAQFSVLLQQRIADERRTLNEGQDALFGELLAEHERVQEERDYWQERARTLEDEVRVLRFRVNGQWETDSDDATVDVAMPCLLFSLQARKTYGALDTNEREFIHTTILNKLRNAELRGQQSEIRQTDRGAYYVYPRSDSAGGRRVLYVPYGHDVKICELFAHHDEYEKALDAGIDLDRYTSFTALEEPDNGGTSNRQTRRQE